MTTPSAKPAKTNTTQDEKPTCFIAMPITVYPQYLQRYNNRHRHFAVTLTMIIAPAVERAGFTPILPISEGSEVIQKAIMHQLKHADMALVDLSAHNPNVFLEAGIRIACNKPAAFIKDKSQGERIPFDVSSVNVKEYDAMADADLFEPEIEAIAKHIRVTYEKSQNSNMVWTGYQMGESIDLTIQSMEKSEVLKQLVENHSILAGKLNEVIEKMSLFAHGAYNENKGGRTVAEPAPVAPRTESKSTGSTWTAPKKPPFMNVMGPSKGFLMD